MSDSEKPEAFSTSLYVTDKAAYEECKRLLKLQDRSLSEEIMDFVLKRRDELKFPLGNGSTESSIDSGRRLEELRTKHFQILQKIDKFKGVLDEKKVYSNFFDLFARTAGISLDDECPLHVQKFLKHATDESWKKATTRFLVSARNGGLSYTFLDFLNSHRERIRLERKLLEMQTDPEELARLDMLERQREQQEEEQTRKDREIQKRKEQEELERRRREDESEPLDLEEDEEEEDAGLVIDSNRPDTVLIEDDDDEESDEEEGEDVPKENKNEPPEDPTEHPIVPVGESRAVA